MKWALLLWATSPTAYNVHSVYLQQEHCQEQVARYETIFKQTNAKMHAECRPAKEAKLANRTDVVYKHYVISDAD